jgi:L-ascorbate metabolism protein UlaG (beta-lactamase superfamily)
VGRLLALREGLGFCWIGNAGWLIRGEGKLIAFDPDLDPAGLRAGPLPVTAEELGPRLDFVFITHEHGDHFNDHTGRVLAQRSDCLFVVPANCVEKAFQLGLPDGRICVARPGEPFDLNGIRVEPLRALHGHRGFTVYSGANFEDCGYVLELSGMRILQPGDTVLLEDHLTLGKVDVLFVSPTEHNMHVQRSADFIGALEPAHVFPQHFGTYRVEPDNAFWTVGHPEQLYEVLPPELRARYHQLPMGGVFHVT